MYTSKEFEDEVIEEALDKAFERLGYNQYSFSEELKDTYEYEMTDYDNTDGFFDDLACSGCQGMALGGFIYHDELEDFYIRHHDDIESFKSYLEQDIGSPLYDGSGHYADFACWLVIEEVAYNVREELPDCLEEAVEEEITSQSIEDQDAFIEGLSKEDIKCFVIDCISENESLSVIDDGPNLVDLENGVTENRLSNGQVAWRFTPDDPNSSALTGTLEYYNEEGELTMYDVVKDGKHPWQAQVSKYHFNEIEEFLFSKFQPVKVMDGWVQQNLDGNARLFKEDPSNINDDINDLARKLAIPLLKSWETDPLFPSLSELIRIKPDKSRNVSQEETQSLSAKAEKKSNGMKM